MPTVPWVCMPPIRRYGKKLTGRMCYRIEAVGRLILQRADSAGSGLADRSVPGHEFDLEVSFLVGKKQLGKIIDKCIRRRLHHRHRDADRIKALIRTALRAIPCPLRTWWFPV